MSLLGHLQWGSSTKRQPAAAADYSSLPLHRLRPSPTSSLIENTGCQRRESGSRQHDYSNCCICLCIFFILSIIFALLYILVLKPIVEAHSRHAYNTYSSGISHAQDNTYDTNNITHRPDDFKVNNVVVSTAAPTVDHTVSPIIDSTLEITTVNYDQPNISTVDKYTQTVNSLISNIKTTEPTVSPPVHNLTVNSSHQSYPDPTFIVFNKWASSYASVSVKQPTLIAEIEKSSNFEATNTSTSIPSMIMPITTAEPDLYTTPSTTDSATTTIPEVYPEVNPVAGPPSSRESEYDDLFWMRRSRPAGHPNYSHNTYQLVGPKAADENDLKEIIEQVDHKEDTASLPPIQSTTISTTASVKPVGSLINYREIQPTGLVIGDGLDVDIQPVQITLGLDEEIIGPVKPHPDSSKTSGLQSPEEPVWRRLPPKLVNESEPTPPLPPALVRPFAISATITTVRKQAGGKKARHKSSEKKSNSNKSISSKTSNKNLVRKRRQAPIIVTSLMDIGRGNWSRFTRHFDQYLDFFLNVLRLENYFIIYCEKKVIDFLNTIDGLDWDRLQVVEITLSDLPFYRWKDEIQEIMNYEQLNWSSDWDIQMKTHPEAVYSDYNILVNSKPYFLYNATQISKFDPFKADDKQFFVWVDAGYGHGSAEAIPTNLWSPKQLKSGQITLVKLTTVVERVERYTLEMVYRKQKSVISGGFLAGDVSTISRFYTFFVKTFMELLDEGRVDDDQTTLLATILEYRSTFNVLHGGWFDAFKLLPSQ
uniref:Uncharacterized protein n=1 Tax=Ditylenchus dipsaci TaxID=166011 RepID=A0A915DP24_9BILA